MMELIQFPPYRVSSRSAGGVFRHRCHNVVEPGLAREKNRRLNNTNSSTI